MASLAKTALAAVYGDAFEKRAITEEEYDNAAMAESMADARARYRKLLKNKALDEIDDDLVSGMKRRRAIAGLASLGALAGLGYGFARHSKPTMLASGLVGGLGLLGRNIEGSNLKKYLEDPKQRRIENLGTDLIRPKGKRDYEALAALLMDQEAGRV